MAVTTASAIPHTDDEFHRDHQAGGGVTLLHGVLVVMLLAFCVDLVMGGPNGSYPNWLAGWGVDAFELVAGLLVVARGIARRTTAATHCCSERRAAHGRSVTSR